MKALRVFRMAILLLWAFHGGLSYLFVHTRGLAYSDADAPGGIAYVRDLHSSGGNDNISIEMGVVFAGLAIAWAAARAKAEFGVADLVANGILLGLQGAYLMAIEVGSLFTTVVLARNVLVGLWAGTFVALWVCLANVAVALIIRRRSASKPGDAG